MPKYKLRDYRVTSFDSGVEGVDPITTEGTEVPQNKEKKVFEAAEASGREIVKVEKRNEANENS